MLARLYRYLKGWRLLALGAILGACLFVSVIVIVPVASPAIGADMADFLRTIVGPAPVADVESFSFWAHDLLNRGLSSTGLGAPRVAWAGGTSSTPLNMPGGINILRGKAAAQAEPTAKPPASGQGTLSLAPVPQTSVVTDAPQIGWQAYGPEVNGAPVMARAMVMVDPTRSYAGVALVRMDLTKLALHTTPGTIEPAHPSGINQQIPDIGAIPSQDYNSIVAAFNGGFKSVHGHYGMMVNGVTLLQPIDGMATIAIYKDGRVRIGAWGTDIQPSADMVAFRQNCPPLIDNGAINPLLSTDARGAWGFTNNQDITWRTGVGISKDGRFLIYAVGNGTNAEFLAQALQQAGAYNAMQLDINQYYAHFVTFAQANGSLQADRLLQEMIDEKSIYLTPQVRDFFYVTAR